MLGLLCLLLIRQLCTLLWKREHSRSHGRGRAVPQCHPVTCRSKEGKSQVSPSGPSTDPALHLGAIMGSSYLNSVQLSWSIFFLFLISLVIIIPQRHLQTPTETSLQSDGTKRPLLGFWAPHQTLTMRNLHLKKKLGWLWKRLPSKQKTFCKRNIWSCSKISFHQCLILHRRIVITDSLPSGIHACLCPFFTSAKAGSSFLHGELL